MRNLKKLLAVIVAICVLATFTVPAFAEDTKTAAKIAEELGVIKGTGDGVTAEYLATQPDRLQGAIMFLRLKGLEDDAIAFTGTDNFADIAGLNATNKAILAYLKANPELGFGGIGGNKFAATEKMEAKQYYKVMLTALGYTYGTDDTADFTWNNVMSFAATKGLVKLVDVTKFTVNDLCVGTVEALKATVKGGTDILIAKLVLAGNIAADVAASTGLYVPSAVALTVTSATADNLIVAKIVFNKDLNKDTIIPANFSASGLQSVTLGADNRTVYAKLTNKVAQDTAVEFTIKNVKDTTGATIAEVKRSVTFRDIVVPVINGVTVKNAKTLIISASEPINYAYDFNQHLNSIKIDGASAFGTTAVDYAKNEIVVTLYSAMATGTHKIDIADLTDYAGYKAVAQSFNVEVAADTTAPVLTSAVMKTTTEIEVTFDEDVFEFGTFLVGTSGLQAATPSYAGTGTDKSKIKLAFSTPLDIGAVVQIKIEYKGQKDVMGNEVKTATIYTFKVDDDTTLPTASATIAAGNKITVAFSKAMAKAGTIKVLDANNNALTTYDVSTLGFKDTNYNSVEISSLGERNPMDVKVNITGMKDASVRGNVLAEQNIALKLFDSKLPEVAPEYVATANNSDHKLDSVTFFFNEPMNVDSIKSLANYVVSASGLTARPLSTVDGASLKEVAADGKSVSFYVPYITTTYNGATFDVYLVKDLAENTRTITAGITRRTPTPFMTNGVAYATDRRTVKISFNNKFSQYDYTAFVVKGSNNFIAYGVGGSTDNTLATITLNQDLPTTTGALSLEFTNNAANLKDIYGTAVTSGAGAVASATITDQIKPVVTVAAGTTAGSIVISFTEPVTSNGATVPAGVTTISGLLNDILIWKDGTTSVDLTTNAATTVSFLKAGAPADGTDFDAITIIGLSPATNYSVTVRDINITDKATPANKTNVVNAYVVKTN